MAGYITITANIHGEDAQYFATDGGDGWYYFYDRYFYRKAANADVVQMSYNYNQSQHWVTITGDASSGTFNPTNGNGSQATNAGVETFVQWCINIANDSSHGYDQTNRNGPDYDCSSFIWHGLNNAGFNVGNSAFTTYTMPSILANAGWSNIGVPDVSNLERGDILLKSSHTELYIGQQQRVGARSNEFGGITGGVTGDQSGYEIAIIPYSNTGWTSVWRYNA